MEKVIFIDEKWNPLFKVLDLKGFILPQVGHSITWMHRDWKVEQVDHDYDEKEINIVLKAV